MQSFIRSEFNFFFFNARGEKSQDPNKVFNERVKKRRKPIPSREAMKM